MEIKIVIKGNPFEMKDFKNNLKEYVKLKKSNYPTLEINFEKIK